MCRDTNCARVHMSGCVEGSCRCANPSNPSAAHRTLPNAKIWGATNPLRWCALTVGVAVERRCHVQVSSHNAVASFFLHHPACSTTVVVVRIACVCVWRKVLWMCVYYLHAHSCTNTHAHEFMHKYICANIPAHTHTHAQTHLPPPRHLQHTCMLARRHSLLYPLHTHVCMLLHIRLWQAPPTPPTQQR